MKKRKTADHRVKKPRCPICQEILDEDCAVLADGRTVCWNCGSIECTECSRCGRKFLNEDLVRWKEEFLCSDCAGNICPYFDERENERNTKRAYKAMLERYIDRKVLNFEEIDYQIECELPDTMVRYWMQIEFDEDGYIVEMSRLSAEMYFADWEYNPKWEPYPIKNEDYTTIIEMLVLKYGFIFEDENVQ